jgi:hypothetical protein
MCFPDNGQQGESGAGVRISSRYFTAGVRACPDYLGPVPTLAGSVPIPLEQYEDTEIPTPFPSLKLNSYNYFKKNLAGQENMWIFVMPKKMCRPFPILPK